MIYLQDPDVTLYHGDALEVLRTLPDRSVHMCATSPPFYGLRDYGTGTWEGGDEGCDHLSVRPDVGNEKGNRGEGYEDGFRNSSKYRANDGLTRNCRKCGARRIDRQIGLEESPDEWVARLVEVFREVRRVLRDDGTLWVEIGDSYWSDSLARDTPIEAMWGNRPSSDLSQGRDNIPKGNQRGGFGKRPPGLKPKDLLGSPWLLAFALRADGWYLRSEIIWARPNPMPESVTDRPTKAHSTVFLLSKSPRYYFDAEAIREQPNLETIAHRERYGGKMTSGKGLDASRMDGDRPANGGIGHNPAGANARSVWTIPTEPTPFAHFATWPQKLVSRMILAGTSERGVCPECGAPWVRETRPSAEYNGKTEHHPARKALNPERFAAYLRECRAALGLSMADVDKALGTNTAYSWWEGRSSGTQLPTPVLYAALKPVIGMDDRFDEFFEFIPRTNERGGWIEPGTDTLVEGNRKQGASETRGMETVGWRPSCDHDAEPIPATCLDMFAGSGTTLLVARKLGRRAIGIELNAEYAELASQRLAQQSLFADAHG